MDILPIIFTFSGGNVAYAYHENPLLSSIYLRIYHGQNQSCNTVATISPANKFTNNFFVLPAQPMQQVIDLEAPLWKASSHIVLNPRNAPVHAIPLLLPIAQLLS